MNTKSINDDEPISESGPVSVTGSISYNNLLRRAKEISDSQPMTVGISSKEISGASHHLIQSTSLIVESIITVIREIEEQNKQQAANHESGKFMMNILESELQATRSDNRTTRRLIWASIVISLMAVAFQFYTINVGQEISRDQEISFTSTNRSLSKALEIMTQTREIQDSTQKRIEQSPVISIESLDKKGDAAIKVVQPAPRTDKKGPIVYDVVKIPISIKKNGVEIEPK